MRRDGRIRTVSVGSNGLLNVKQEIHVNTQKTRKVSKQRGFTLIELMIVVAVIAVLAASCILKLRHFIARGKIATAVTAGRCIQGSLASYAVTSQGNSYPQLYDYDSIAQVANSNGCPMPREGFGVALPVAFGGFWCYRQDPLTGTIYIVPCDPSEPFEYHLELLIPEVQDTKIVVDSLMGVRAVPILTSFP